MIGFDQETNGVHFVVGGESGLHHDLVQTGFGLVDSRRIQKNDLAFGEVLDPEKAVAGGLGSVGDDGQLLAQETVEERRLAGIGPPDKGDKAGFEIRSVFSRSSWKRL